MYTMTGAVRLVNGSTKYEGRVEVFYNGEWGTVCDDGWDLNDAQVVCNELGLGDAVAAKHNAFYGKGNGQIWFFNVNCIGTESLIDKCSHEVSRTQKCSHFEDPGVKCAAGNLKGQCTQLYKLVMHVHIVLHICI